MESTAFVYIVLLLLEPLSFLWILFYFIPVGLWFTALLSDVRVSLIQLVLMRWRKVPPQLIVRSMISATKAGLKITRNDLEAPLPGWRKRGAGG